MSRRSLAVAFAIFVVGYGTNVSTPFLVPYRDRLGLGDSQTQAIFVIYVVGILATLLLAGQISDHFGRRAVMFPSLLLSALASVLLIFGRDNFALLLAGRIVLGVASGAGLGVGAAWLQEVMGKGNELRAALTATLAMYGGFGAGSPVSALFHAWLPSPLVLPFIAHIIFTLAAIPLVATVDETVLRQGNAAPWRPSLQFGVPDRARHTFAWTMLPVGVWTFGFPSVSFALFPVLVSDAVDISQVFVAAVTGMCTAWGGLLARPTLKRIKPLPGLGFGMAVGTFGYALGIVAVLTDLWVLVWPAALTLGAASGILATASLSLVARMTEPETRGALTSTFYFLAYIGMAMPLLITTIGGQSGQVAVVAVLAAIAAAITLSTPWRHRQVALH